MRDIAGDRLGDRSSDGPGCAEQRSGRALRVARPRASRPGLGLRHPCDRARGCGCDAGSPFAFAELGDLLVTVDVIYLPRTPRARMLITRRRLVSPRPGLRSIANTENIIDNTNHAADSSDPTPPKPGQ